MSSFITPRHHLAMCSRDTPPKKSALSRSARCPPERSSSRETSGRIKLPDMVGEGSQRPSGSHWVRSFCKEKRKGKGQEKRSVSGAWRRRAALCFFPSSFFLFP